MLFKYIIVLFEDVNECHMFPDMCKNGGVCINSDGSFICQCPPHLTLDQTGLRCFGERVHVTQTLITHSCLCKVVDIKMLYTDTNAISVLDNL